MKLSLGADMKMNVVKRALQWLEENGHQVTWYGPEGDETQPWPQVAHQVAEDVAAGRAQEGILFCWTGTGVSIAANKVPGIRAALCFDAETTRGARLWNDANVLCLSMRLTTEVVVEEILEMWFSTSYQPNPGDEACLALLREMDQN
jgi:ribose 5-phosphate isomerase B